MLFNYSVSVVASDVKVKEKCVFCSLVEKGVTDIFNFALFSTSNPPFWWKFRFVSKQLLVYLMFSC